MSKLVHLPELAGMLMPGQFEVTEFVFDVFKKNPSWDGRTDVVVSLLRAAVFPQHTDPDDLRSARARIQAEKDKPWDN